MATLPPGAPMRPRMKGSITEQRLIVEVSKFPELYALRSRSFRDLNRKDAIWKTIAYNFSDLSEQDLKKKWKTLRDRFLRERKAAREKSSATGKDHRPSWKYFPIMSFLEPHVQEREKYSNSNYAERQHDDMDIPAVILDEDDHIISPDWPSADRAHHEDDDQQSSNQAHMLDPSGGFGIGVAGDDSSPPSPQLPLLPPTLPEKRGTKAKKHKGVEIDAFEKQCLSVLSNKADGDELFLLSLAPRMQKLSEEQKSLLKMEIMAAFHKVEFSLDIKAH